MSVTCRIEFENSPHKVVYSGQLIRGNAIVDVREDIFVCGVYLRLFGGAYTRFPDQNRNGQHRGSLSRNEKYLDERIICFRGTTEKLRLKAGSNRFPFECQLPSLIPTSLEKKYGYIRYTASLWFNEFWDETPIHQELFTIIKPLNLNLLPHLHKPFESESKTTFRRWNFACFPKYEMKMVVSIPQRGYTAGQNIDLRVDVHSKSGESIYEINAQLIRKMRFMGTEDAKMTIVTMLNEETVHASSAIHGETNAYQMKITVPSTPPTDEKSSKIIQISYNLRIIAFTNSCHHALSTEIPITIGTYPINRKSTNQANWDNQTNMSPEDEDVDVSFRRRISSIDFPKPSAPYPEYDPPTYEEAVGHDPDNYDDNFKPKYPVYRRPN